jgi:hypothetical protein
MRKNYLLLIIVLIITAILSNITYVIILGSDNIVFGGSNIYEEILRLSLLNEFINNPNLLSRLIILQILFPFIFTIETFLVEYPFRKGIRLMFIIQSILAFVGIICSYWLMTNHWFVICNQNDFNTSIIIVFESVFALWSLLLGIPYTNKIRIFNFFFAGKT